MSKEQPIKLVQINVNRRSFEKRWFPWLAKQQADIICVQEILQNQVIEVADYLGMKYCFLPETHFTEAEASESDLEGVAILSRYGFDNIKKYYYRGSGDSASFADHNRSIHPEDESNNLERINTIYHRGLLTASVSINKTLYTVGTTHFTWAYYGSLDKNSKKFVWKPDQATINQQITDAKKVLNHINKLDNYILCIDTNSPRGTEVFSLFSNSLRDNIPKNITSSIDGSLHRAGSLPLMIDGIFSTPNYVLTNVQSAAGLSDHLAFTASIAKA